MGKGFAKKKKQAKMMQEQMSKLQEEMQNAEAIGTAGNGMVTITLSGEHEMKKISINPECVDPEDVEGLEDLVVAAYQNALKKLQKSSPMKGIPGMPDLGGFGF